MYKKDSGILLHISSLPSNGGIGSLGKSAYNFVDFLERTKQSYWQILPLTPCGKGCSPYFSDSAFAGNTMLIDLENLAEHGIIDEKDIKKIPNFSTAKADRFMQEKENVLRKAYNNKEKLLDNHNNEYSFFLSEHNWWLHNYAIFKSIKNELFDSHWNTWPKELMECNPEAIQYIELTLAKQIEYEKFKQFIFYWQWYKLKKYANDKGIQIFGDIPLYISDDSADTWLNKHLFLLDHQGRKTMVAGVPPDYFSKDGQLWGNPLYDWNNHSKDDYSWWMARLRFNLHMYDIVRLDHFRGLDACWAVDVNEGTAKNGQWLPAHGDAILSKLRFEQGNLNIVAEDLGSISNEVRGMMSRYNLRGMKVFQFGFLSNEENEHLMHNLDYYCIAYSGTHDNHTLRGWADKIKGDEKELASKYYNLSSASVVRNILSNIYASNAQTVIIPIQDFMGLGDRARMNIPGNASGNWTWRITQKELCSKNLEKQILDLTVNYNRARR